MSKPSAAKLGLLLLVIWANTVLADWLPQSDEVKLQLNRMRGSQLFWDNFEADRFWLAGPKPEYDRFGRLRPDRKMHWLHLQPQQWSAFLLPAGAWLRVIPQQNQASPVVYFSDDSQVYLEAKARMVRKGQLYFAPHLTRSRVVRIQAKNKPIRLALFRSRVDKAINIAPYRRELAFKAPSLKLHEEPGVGRQQVYALHAGTALKLKHQLQGKQRLELVVWPRYPYKPATLRDELRLQVLDKGKAIASWSLLKQPQLRRVTTINGRAEVLAVSRRVYLSLPEGSHQLALKLDNDAYVRLAAQDNPDYLLPKLNQPRPSPVQLWYAKDMVVAGLISKARRLARNNQRRDGVHQALKLLQQAAEHWPDMTELRQQADVIASLYSFQRNLQPQLDDRGGRPARYLTRRLLRTSEVQKLVWQTDHADAHLAGMEQAEFFSLPARRIKSFLLPEQTGPGLLKLILANPQPHQEQTLSLRINREKSRRLILMPHPLLSSEWFQHSTQAAVLDKRNNKGALHESLLGRLAALDKATGFVQAAWLEMVLPEKSRRIQISGAGQKLDIALKIRASRPFDLQEKAHLEAVKRLQPNALQWFSRLIKKQLQGNLRLIDDRHNHWLPLARVMAQRIKEFRQSTRVQADWLTDLQILTEQEKTRLLQQIRVASKQKRWSDAVGYALKLAQGSRKKQRWLNLKLLSDILRKADEPYLSSRLQRQLLLACLDQTSCWQLATDMAQEAAASEDQLLQLQVYTVYFHQWQDPRVIQRLSDFALQQGQWQWILDLQGLLPIRQRNAEAWLISSFRRGWWQHFEDQRLRLSGAAERALWQGHKWLKQGDLGKARQAYVKAGKKGRPWLQSLRQGRQIAMDIEARQGQWGRIIQRWRQWQLLRPGKRFWQQYSDNIDQHAGTALLLSRPLESRSNGYIAAPSRPLKFRILGPLQIQLKIRPMHLQTEDMAPLQDRIEIKVNGKALKLAVAANPANPALMFEGRSQIPGALLERRIQLPAGINHVQISSQEHRHFVRIFSQQPSIDLAILPELKLEHLQPSALSRNPLHKLPVADEAVDWVDSGSVRQQFVSLQAGVQLQEKLKSYGLIEDAGPIRDQSLALRDQLAEILWRKERGEISHQQAFVAAEKIQADKPQDKVARGLWQQLVRGTRWQLKNSVEASAGVKKLPQSTNLPELPSLRLRAVLSQVQPDAQMLSYAQSLQVALAEVAGRRLKISVRHRHPGFLKAYPISLSYRLDQGGWQQLELTQAGQLKQITLALPKPRHFLEIRLDAAEPNHYAQIRLFDGKGLQIQPNPLRNYHLATAQEPLRLKIKAPAWLRIDQWQSSGNRQNFRQISGNGWQTLILKPRPGERQSLFRIYQRVISEQPPERTRTAHEVEQTPERLPVSVVATDLKIPRQIEDNLRLGRQEDGTWSPYLAYRFRPGSGEDSSGEDGFFELGVNYRLYDPVLHGWYKVNPLIRLHHDYEQPTLGLVNRWQQRMESKPWTLKLESRLFAQSVEESIEWSAEFNASVSDKRLLGLKSWHIPRIEAFARYLSLNHSPDQQVDSDVFSSYKNQHKLGWSVADSIYHQPFLDTMLYAGAELQFNQNPLFIDHVKAEMGWRQLFAEVEADLRLRRRHYFTDRHRDNAYNATDVRLQLNWLGWRDSRHGFQLGFQVNYDIEDEQWYGGLSFSWHDAEGRGLRDFAPGEINFRPNREWQIPTEPVNVFE